MSRFEPTAEIESAYNALVQSELIDAARRAHSDALARCTRTAAEVNAAQQAQESARAASNDAVAGKGDLSPLDAETALETAERHLRVAEKVNAAAEQARVAAEAAVHHAEGQANLPAYRAGMVLRFRACLAAEEAQKALDAAQRLYDQSAWMMNRAQAYGVQRATNDPAHSAGNPVRDALSEALYWREPFGWYDGNVNALIEEAGK